MVSDSSESGDGDERVAPTSLMGLDEFKTKELGKGCYLEGGR